MVIIDFDNFKKYNDNYGHLTGDYLLSATGNIIQDNLRASDILLAMVVMNWLLFPETDAESAVILIERIKNKIDECEFNIKDIHKGK